MTKATRPQIPDLQVKGPQTSLLAVGLASMLSLVLVGVLLYENQAARSRAVEDGRTVAYHEATTLGRIGSHAIELSDRGLLHFLEHFQTEFQEIKRERDHLTETLYSRLPEFPPRSDLTFFDTVGRAVASTDTSHSYDSDVLGVLFGEDGSGALDVTISAVDKPYGGRVVIGRRARDASGRFAGVVGAALDFSALDAAQDLSVTRQIDHAFFVAESGTVLASWPTAWFAEKPGVELPSPLKNLPRQLPDNTGIRVIESDEWIVAVRTLRNAPILAGVGISKDRILKQWRSASWVVYSWVFAIVAGAGILSAGLMFLRSRRHAASEKLFQTLSRAVEASPAMVFICDAEGLVEYVNLKYTEFSGRAFGEVIGAPPYFLEADSASPKEVEAIRRNLSAGKEWSGILQIEDRHGNTSWVSIMVSPIRDSRGRITNFVGSMEDVTHRVEDEQRLRKMQKMEALEILVGGVSHEFNNLLMPVVGLCELTLAKLSPDSPVRKYVETVLVSGKRAASMIDQVRMISTPENPMFEKCGVGDLLRDLAEKARPLVPKHISLRIGSLPVRGDVLVDRRQFETAVNALVSNAVQAISEKPGELGIEARVSTSLESGGPQVTISFSDTGCGMTEDIAAKALDPFFTTREVGEGTGLGLSVAQGIILAHGGSISIESALGMGTTVSITLPVLVDEEAVSRDEQVMQVC